MAADQLGGLGGEEEEEPDESDAAATPVGAEEIPTIASQAQGRGRSRRGAAGPFRIHTAACNGKSSKDLFSAVAQHLGWREVDVDIKRPAGAPSKGTAATIYCMMQSFDILERLPLRPNSWATRYLGLPDMCDKANLARMVRLTEELLPEGTFAYNPATWVLPEQLDELRTAMSKSSRTFIIKPEDGSQGDGIFLVQGVRDLEVKLSVKANKAAVAQRYLDKPLLHKGYKFDFRVYVALVGGCSSRPPRVFLCREGLARFCTEPYNEPAHANMHKCMGHLTNYSLNKRSAQFEHGGETLEAVFNLDSTATKRPLSVALQQIAEEHPNFCPETFYERLCGVVRTTVALMAPVLAASGREFHTGGDLRSCQLLGFDVMLDHHFVPYLLEVNNSPSLCIDEALPLDPDEAASFAEKGSHGGGRGAMRARNGDTVCRCMDLVQPHRHQTALVDLVVKRTAMVGLFRLLEQLGAGQEDPRHEDYIPVEVRGDQVYELMSSVEALFTKAGGAPKAFTSGALRRIFGPVCGRGGLEKHDLDSLAPKMRATRFNMRDLAGKTESLRLYDYLEATRQVAAKAFPGAAPGEAVRQVIAIAGAA